MKPYPPDGGLKDPVRKPEECFSAFTAIKEHFRMKAPNYDDPAFRAANLLGAAERYERKAEQCLEEAKRYREIANRILGGTAAAPR